MMKRRYTVGVKPGYMDNQTPEIRIGGKWLSKAGINVGDRVDLSVDEKLIIISPATDEDEMIEEEPVLDIPDTRFPTRMKTADIVNSILLKCH